VHGQDYHRKADANIPYHCHTERPQVSHVLEDATVIHITRQEVHTHHQVADVHTRITRIHFPYTRHTGNPHSHAPWVGVRSLSQPEKVILYLLTWASVCRYRILKGLESKVQESINVG